MGERAKICCAFSAVISRKLTHDVKVHAREEVHWQRGGRFPRPCYFRKHDHLLSLSAAQTLMTALPLCGSSLPQWCQSMMQTSFFISHGYATWLLRAGCFACGGRRSLIWINCCLLININSFVFRLCIWRAVMVSVAIIAPERLKFAAILSCWNYILLCP
jgi:hypothetical protein